MTRNDLLKTLLPLLSEPFVICNIGIPSQELYALGDRDNYFYMLGSMGMCGPIGLGLALSTPAPVVAIEGDGSVLMNLGALVTLAHQGPGNLTLVVIDNGSYGSTGDQPTYTAAGTSLAEVARAAGCTHVVECNGIETADALQTSLKSDHFSVIVAKVDPGNAPVGAVPLHPIMIRERFKNRVATTSFPHGNQQQT